DDFARFGVKLRHNVVTALAADQDPSHRPGIADTLLAAAAHDLARRAIGEVRTVAFACVNHHHAAPARGLEHTLAGCDDRLQRCDVVAERLAEATRLDEIPLHVYDDERGRR